MVLLIWMTMKARKNIQMDKDFKSLQFQRKKEKTNEDQMTSCLKKCLLG